MALSVALACAFPLGSMVLCVARTFISLASATTRFSFFDLALLPVAYCLLPIACCLIIQHHRHDEHQHILIFVMLDGRGDKGGT